MVGDMLMPVGFPSSLELHGEGLRMPFSDPIKYCILGISVTLLVLALAILLWQVSRYCTQTRAAPDTANSELLYSDDDAPRQLYDDAPRQVSEEPRTKAEEGGVETKRMSRCPSSGLFPSSLGEGEQGEPEKQIHGSLRFSVYYDQLQSRLVVTVLQAEGLQGRSQERRLHPFVKLRLVWAGPVEEAGLVCVEGEGKAVALRAVVQECETRVVKDSCSPVFGEQFSCTVQQQEVQHFTLRMEVRDFDKFSRHMVLGEVRVPLGQLKMSYPLELQQDLQTPQKDLVGEVLLSLKFLPTSQRLEVGLLKIRTLLTESDTVLSARIGVQCNQCKLRQQKTSTMPQRQVTVFNQVLIFSLPEPPLQECTVLLSVYETPTTRKSPKHLIGQLSVGKRRSSEDQHWSLMMRSLRQPVAKWHQLLV